MVQRNSNFSELRGNYLFVEIDKRKKDFAARNPQTKLISLGIGDTTEPIPPPIVAAFSKKSAELGTLEGYTGYPEYNGDELLRKRISEDFYNGIFSSDEIFISDGSKPDLGRLQLLFSSNATLAVQDPVYPVYVDAAVMSGKAGRYNENSKRFDKVTYMSCLPENNFFPDLKNLQRTDLIFFCSPNNPTGAVATKEQLTALVEFAKKNKSIIIFDSAYREFISDPSIPKSIFEIEGAKEVCFETSSFSKIVGFTGVRLGWTVCPKELKFADGSSVRNDWARIQGTCFNGPSNLAEAGGLACFTKSGKVAIDELVKYYLSNTNLLRLTMERCGFEVHGGLHSPYLWIRVFPKTSWNTFQEILDFTSVVTTPGVGFGKGGEGYIRISSFAHKDNVIEACSRLEKHFIQQNHK